MNKKGRPSITTLIWGIVAMVVLVSSLLALTGNFPLSFFRNLFVPGLDDSGEVEGVKFLGVDNKFGAAFHDGIKWVPLGDDKDITIGDKRFLGKDIWVNLY